ncbi:MAG: hypothetical protein ABIR96_10045, partial [Bdellovibrionota bacterium]
IGSDESLRRGISGTYSRVFGMEAMLVELRSDGSYVVTVQGCLMSEEEGRGRWLIEDGVLILKSTGDRKPKREHPSRFEIVVVEGDIALKPADETAESRDGEPEERLFRHEKKEANQTLQHNAITGRFSVCDRHSSRG